MKKFILLSILLVFCFSSADAQKRNRKRGGASITDGKQLMQIGIGYNLSFINPKGLNYAIQQSNQSLMTNSNHFSKLSITQGFSGALTWYGKYEDCKHRKLTSYLFEIGYNNGRQSIDGKSSNTNLISPDNTTKIDLDMHNVSIKYGFMPSLGNIDIGLGAGLDAGISSLYSNINSLGRKNIETNVNYGVSVFMPIYITFGKESLFSLGIRPYYQYQINTNNAQKLYNTLNINPIQPENTKQLEYRLNNYGVEFQLCFMLHKLNYH